MNFLPQNAANWHTIIVHLPAFTLLFSLALLLIAAAMKDGRFQRVALMFIILAAAGIYIVADTGDAAKQIVEQLPDVESGYIEHHEAAADKAVWAMYGLGALSLIVLLATVKQKRLSGKMVLLMVILTFAVAGWLVYTAKLGGQINHPENRPSFIGPDLWGSGSENDSDAEEDSVKNDNDGER
jgi:uncharacterized membrane protein